MFRCARTLKVMLLLMVPFVAAACRREPPPRSAEAAPFELLDGERLHVREDLAGLLKFERVDASEVAADIVGLGNLAFAPGAAYALRVPFNGFVEAVHVDVGQVVVDDQLLATIRSSEVAKLRADLKRLIAEIESQESALKNAKVASASGSIPQRRVVELETKVTSLHAEATGIRQSLAAGRAAETGTDLLELRAPRGGHVITRKLDPGELVEDPDNIPAFVVADPENLVLKASFPERDAPLLKEGFPCRISVSTLGEQQIPGKVLSVVRAIDPASRSVQAVIGIDEFDSRLRAEMLARVSVHIHGPTRVLVPRSAVLLRRDSRVVLVRAGDREIVRRIVVVGAQVGSKLEVISGLNTGEEVVIEGAVLLDGELDRLL